MVGPAGTETLSAAIERGITARSEANAELFARDADRIARCSRRLAESFARGGRLLTLAASPTARSDARHVSVEFVHPVIVGKRALPALALTGEGGPVGLQLEALIEPEDVVMGFGLDQPGGEEVRTALATAAALGCEVIHFDAVAVCEGSTDREWAFAPPSADEYVRQELVETIYHVLWELVHVFLDHLGRLDEDDADAGVERGAGASSFLYPFLSSGGQDFESLIDDARASVLMKAEEVAELRRQTLTDGTEALIAAARTLRRSFASGGRLLAFGNGGSATDAMDLVADFRVAPRPDWKPRPAIDLTEDTAIITAVANDVGVAEVFQRQLISHGRQGDVAVAFSTSGGSQNLIEALAEARRGGLGTVAMVGYDGGRIAAEGLADHVVVSRSQHIPRIQEAQASAYHLLRELVEAVEPD